MNVIDYIDLVEFLKSHNNKLNKVKIYCKITGLVEEMPKSLLSSVVPNRDSDSVCVGVDILAVNLAEYKDELLQLGISTPDSIYFANGSITTFVPKHTKLNDWYTLSGTLRLAQRVVSSVPVVAMLNFYRIENENKWGIRNAYVEDLAYASFTAPNSRILEYMIKSYNSIMQDVIQPPEVSQLTRFYKDDQNSLDSFEYAGVEVDIFAEERLRASIQSSTSKHKQNTPQVYNTDFKDDITIPTEHMKAKPINSKAITNLRNDLLQAKELNKQYREQIASKFNLDTTQPLQNPYVAYLTFALMHNFNKSEIIKTTNTGKQLLINYIKQYDNTELTQQQVEDILNAWFKASSIAFQTAESNTNLTEYETELYKQYFSDVNKFYAGIIAIITGVSFRKLVNTAEVLNTDNISIITLLNCSPYAIYFLADELSFKEIEYLAICFGVADIPEFWGIKNACILAEYLSSDIQHGNLYTKADLKANKDEIGLKINISTIDKTRNKQAIISKQIIDNLIIYINSNFADTNFNYANTISNNIVKLTSASTYTVPLNEDNLVMALDYCRGTGAIIETDRGTAGFIHQSLAIKELYIYTKLCELSQKYYHISEVDIERYILDFEKENNISLTAEQKQAITLLRHGVSCISGGVFSGKTVTYRCMEYVNTKLNKNNNTEVYTILATAKDCRNIADMKEFTANTLYVIKNADNLTLDKLYNLLIKIGNADVRLVFMGDIYTSYSTVYKNIFRVVPSIILKSQYRDNATVKIVPCKLEDTGLVTNLLCKQITAGVSDMETELFYSKTGIQIGDISDGVKIVSRDIQVFAKSNDTVYTTNNIIRGVFNTSMQTQQFTCGTRYNRATFKIGDRIICSKTLSDMPRYKNFTENCLSEEYTISGVYSGMIGTIFAIVNSDDLIFTTDKRQECGKYFIIVKYIYNSAYFYTAYPVYLDTQSDEISCRVFKPLISDRNYFELGYCISEYAEHSKTAVIISESGRLTNAEIYALNKMATDTVYIIGKPIEFVDTTYQDKTLGELLCQ